MNHSKTIQLLFLIEKNDYQDLIKFVNSPYFNTSTQLSNLVEHLIDNIDDPDKLINENIFKYLYESESYNNRKLIKVLSKLNTLLINFLAHHELQENKPYKSVLILHALSANENQKFLHSEYIRSLKLDEFTSQDFIADSSLLIKLNIESIISQKATFVDDRSTELPEKLKYLNTLNHYYFKRILRIGIFLKNHSIITNNEYDLTFISKLVSELRANKYLGLVELKIWDLTYSILETIHEQTYYELKELVQENISKFVASEARMIFTILETCCIDIFSPKGKVIEEIFDLYTIQIDHRIFKQSNVFVLGIYKNIVTAACKLNKLDWAHKFIEDYRSYVVPEEYREDIYTYVKSYYNFMLKNFSTTIELLHEVDYNDIFLKLSCKRLFLQTCYEIDDYNLFDNFLNSYRTYLYRTDEISESTKDAELRFAMLLSNLFKAKLSDKSKEKLDNLIEEFNNTLPVSERRWLLEKLKELS